MPEEAVWIEVQREPLFPAEFGIAGFAFDCDTFENIPEMKDRQMYEAAAIVSAPDAVFEDFNRKNYAEALCYSKSLGSNQGGGSTGFVGLAFAVKCDGIIYILDVDHRFEDKANPGFPQFWNRDFGGVVWEKN